MKKQQIQVLWLAACAMISSQALFNAASLVVAVISAVAGVLALFVAA